jgi:MYXO-CTERM domain-containing protein
VQGPAWSDANGWGDPKFYSTIQFADINGDGKADLCGRGGDGIHCQLSDGSGFPTHIAGPAWSDANGWGDPKFYSTIQLADINGDGKADLCGRANDRMHCFLSDGAGFPTHVDGPTWSDANGWDDVFYYATIQVVDVNGDGKADVCGRASDRVRCWLSDGASFPTEIMGPAWSNGAGWANAKYYTTMRYLAASPSAAQPPADLGAEQGDAGVPGGGGGQDEPPGSDSGGGCSLAGAGSASGGVFALMLFAVLAWRARKKSPERRNARGL